MLRGVVQTELGDIKRSSQVGLIRKGFLEEGAFGLRWRRKTWIRKLRGRMNKMFVGQGSVGGGKGGQSQLWGSVSITNVS